MKTKKMIYVGMSEESHARFKAAAEQRELSLSSWIIQAAMSYAKTGESFAKKHLPARKDLWPSGWSKGTVCYVCKKCGHDPLGLHPEMANVDGEIHSAELELLGEGYYKECKA